MPIEHEHRYILKNKPAHEWLNSIHTSVETIEQNYISREDKRRFAERIRSKTHLGDTRYLRTTKIGALPKAREVEYDIPREVYLELRTYFTVGMPIRKVRYSIDIDGLLWEVDIFEAPFEGLDVAELENPPEEYTVPFDDAINVTGDYRFSNVNMAMGNELPELDWSDV